MAVWRLLVDSTVRRVRISRLGLFEFPTAAKATESDGCASPVQVSSIVSLSSPAESERLLRLLEPLPGLNGLVELVLVLAKPIPAVWPAPPNPNPRLNGLAVALTVELPAKDEDDAAPNATWCGC